MFYINLNVNMLVLTKELHTNVVLSGQTSNWWKSVVSSFNIFPHFTLLIRREWRKLIRPGMIYWSQQSEVLYLLYRYQVQLISVFQIQNNKIHQQFAEQNSLLTLYLLFRFCYSKKCLLVLCFSQFTQHSAYFKPALPSVVEVSVVAQTSPWLQLTVLVEPDGLAPFAVTVTSPLKQLSAFKSATVRLLQPSAPSQHADTQPLLKSWG